MDILTPFFQTTAQIDIAPTILALSAILGTIGGILAPILVALMWISRNSIINLQKRIDKLELELEATRKAANDAREKYEKRQDDDAAIIVELKIRIDGFPAKIESLEKLVSELQNKLVEKEKVIKDKVIEEVTQLETA